MNSNSPSRVVALHVEETGSGPAVVLIPGLGYASWSWRAQHPLGESWRLLAVDPRGAGRSPKPPGPYTISGMAADVAVAVRGLAEPPVHVAGFSMGGYLALTLALEYPELVRSLVLVATSAGGTDHVPVPEATRSRWLESSHLPPEDYARATMPLSFAPGWVEAHPEEYRRWLDLRLEHPTPPECWEAQYAACDGYLAEGVPVDQIAVPALVLHGDQDGVVPPKNGRVLADRLPAGRLLEMRGAGHLLHMERPETANAAMSGFFHGVEGGGR